MAFYRCCKVEPTGKIVLHQSFQSPSDNEAIAYADALVVKMAWPVAELWEGLRKVDWQNLKP